MHILRAAHDHPDLQRKPIMPARRFAYGLLPSFIDNPPFLPAVCITVTIMSINERADINWKPRVRALEPPRVVSFVVPKSFQPTPYLTSHHPSPTGLCAEGTPLLCLSPQVVPPFPLCLPPSVATEEAAPYLRLGLDPLLQWLKCIHADRACNEAGGFHLFF